MATRGGPLLQLRDLRLPDFRDFAIDVDGLQSELPPVDQLRRVLAAAGIGDRSKVVIYGSPIAAMVAFLGTLLGGYQGARLSTSSAKSIAVRR